MFEIHCILKIYINVLSPIIIIEYNYIIKIYLISVVFYLYKNACMYTYIFIYKYTLYFINIIMYDKIYDKNHMKMFNKLICFSYYKYSEL